MKVLVVFFSRSGNTRKVAELIGYDLDGKIEEISEDKNRSGFIAYFKSCFEVIYSRQPAIMQPEEDVANYDIVVIGTPVWVASVSSPVRSYLTMIRARLPQVAFFCTMGGRGSSSAFEQMQSICGKPPLATLAIRQRQLFSGDIKDTVNSFATEIQRKWGLTH